jgi:ATP-dependent Lhr-like helicase
MFQILTEGGYRISVGEHKVDFIDPQAKVLFDEAVYYFQQANLAEICVVQHGKTTCIFTWMGNLLILWWRC